MDGESSEELWVAIVERGKKDRSTMRLPNLKDDLTPRLFLPTPNLPIDT
jgi:hypothetical protein